MPAEWKADENRIHPLQRIWEVPISAEFDVFDSPEQIETMRAVVDTVSKDVKTAQEDARRAGRLGSGLACRVEIQLPRETAAEPLTLLMDLRSNDELSELFVVSDADVVPADPEFRKQLVDAEEDEEIREIIRERENPAWRFSVEFECGTKELPAKGLAVVMPPLGEKCVRCWQYLADEPDTLCGRCVGVVGEPPAPEEQAEEDEDDDGLDELSRFR